MRMMNAKKRPNAAQEREERVSLLSSTEAGMGSSSRPPIPTPPSSGNSAGYFNLRKEKRKTSGIAKAHPDMEERVSLLAGDGRPRGPPKRSFRIAMPNRRPHQSSKQAWTLSRMMKYFALMLMSSSMTFVLLRKESKTVHWTEYQNILEPDGTKEKRCYEQSPGTQDKRCTCSDPNKEVANTTTALWMSHHRNMVQFAQHAPEDLDVVFFGDGMIEQLSGTRGLGALPAEGMEEYFEKTFTRKGGGQLNAIALGSSGDTGPNLLWHWENGIKQANLKPKIWFLMVGGNDLFVSKCTDRFVLANILNVLKRIYESQPDAEFIVHGIMPRKDNPDAKSEALGHLWNRAQDINLLTRKFMKHKARMTFVNAGPKFTTESGNKGRRFLDPKLIKDGINPTSQGMKVWGDYIEKKIREIMHGFDKSRLKQKHKQENQNKRNKPNGQSG